MTNKKQLQQDCADYRNALIELLGWATSGARYQSCNPYGIPIIKTSMQLIATKDGIQDYLNVEIPTAKFDHNYFKD
jgi:hypothetical protein